MDAGGVTYDLDFSEARDAIRTLAGIGEKRPDIANMVLELGSAGMAIDCRLEDGKTGITGHPLVRYYPTTRLLTLVTAAAENWEEARIRESLAHCGGPDGEALPLQ